MCGPPLEALDGLSALEPPDMQHLHGDVPIEHVVAGEPDRGHAPTAEEPRHPIAPGQHIPDHGNPMLPAQSRLPAQHADPASRPARGRVGP